MELTMTGRDFYDYIQDDPRFKWIGVREADEDFPDGAVIGSTDGAFPMELSVRSILEQPWEELTGVLDRKRPADVIGHMARIVGYYGVTRNWNKSKLAELRDRRKGNYGLVERTPNLKSELPDEIREMVAKGRPDEMVCEL